MTIFGNMRIYMIKKNFKSVLAVGLFLSLSMSTLCQSPKKYLENGINKSSFLSTNKLIKSEDFSYNNLIGHTHLYSSENIINKSYKRFTVIFDTDAKDRALEIGEKFLNQGKRVFLIDLPDKDPSEMGFKPFTEYIQTAKELDISSLMMHKLNL